MTAKTAIAHTSEVIESFGGAGYIEDTGLPKHLRDAQVYSIWEGTTNVLSLDVLRAIAKEGGLEPLLQDIEMRLASVELPELVPELKLLRDAVARIKAYAQAISKMDVGFAQAGARQFAMSIGRVYAASLVLEFAAWCEQRKQRPATLEVARRYCRRPLTDLRSTDDLDRERLQKLVYG